MELDSQDRRERVRLFFTLEEDIGFTVITVEDSKNAIPVTLLSLSTGGLSFAADKKHKKNIREGSEFLVTGLHLPDLIDPFPDLKAEIKYIIHYKQYDFVSIGGTFKNIPNSIIEKIGVCIDKRMEVETEEEESPGFEVS